MTDTWQPCSKDDCEFIDEEGCCRKLFGCPFEMSKDDLGCDDYHRRVDEGRRG